MSAADDITALVAALAAREAESVGIENLLSEISGALADIVASLDTEPDTSVVDALVAGLRGLTIPAPQVTLPPIVFPELPAPIVNVNVESPVNQVNVPELAAPPAFKGLTVTVTSRDGNGAIRTLSIKPEA